MADKEIKNQKSKIKTTDKKSKTVGLKSKQNKKATVKKEVKVVVKKSETKSTAPLFDLTGKKKGTIALPKELFAGKINDQLMEQAIRVYMTNQRQGTSSTKTRSEVTCSRRKVW